MPPKKAKSKGPTKSQLVAELAQKVGITKDAAARVLDELAVAAGHELKSAGVFTIPGIAKLRVVKRPATAARQGRNPATGEAITIRAKPPSKGVRARVLKNIKDAV